MHRGLACCLAGLLVVASFAPAAAIGTPDGPFGLAQEEFDADQVSLTAALQADGDARWQFTYRMELTTENETAAFENLSADIERNQSAYVDQFRSRIENTVGAAENATEREMSVANVSVATRINSLNEESLGRVEYTFEWNGFASVEDDRITAGDALEGFYLNNETALQFSWQDRYEAVDVNPPPDESGETSVRWNGPADFATNQPRLVIEATQPAGTTTAQTTTDPTGETTAETTTPNPGGIEEGTESVLFPILVGGAIAAVVLGGSALLYWRRHQDADGGGPAPSAERGGDSGSGGSGAGGGGSGAGGGGSGAGGGESGAGGGGDDAGSGGSSGGTKGTREGGDESGAADTGDGTGRDGEDAGDGTGAAAAGPAAGETPEELLSNEERVERFLREQGGRAKQQAVVDAMGWTEAKTSQVVKQMREDGDLESFRIGRENVLKLPEADEFEE